MTRKFKLTEFREKIEAEGTIVVELDDGEPIRIPPPLLWPEPMPRGWEAQQKAILGEQYERWVAAGGSGKLLNAIIEEAQGASTGESSASSDS